MPLPRLPKFLLTRSHIDIKFNLGYPMWKARVTVPQSQGSRVTTPMIKELVTWEESVSRPVNLYRALAKSLQRIHCRTC